MRIAVSGITGLIGAAVAGGLAAGHEILTIGRNEGAHFQCDFSQPDSLKTLDFSGVNAVVHCAGVTDEDFRDDPVRAERQAAAGMKELVVCARSSGVGDFAYISSAHVYGPLEGAIDESSPANPLSDYAKAHFSSEQILQAAAGRGFRAVVFRPCAVFGIPPDLARFRRWSLIPFDFPKSIVREKRIVLKSSGEQYRNFVGTQDIARGVRLWLDGTEKQPFQIINPLGEQSMSIWQFAHLCVEAVEGLIPGPFSLMRVEGQALPRRLDYGSLHPEYCGSQNLEDTVRELTKMLLALQVGECRP